MCVPDSEQTEHELLIDFLISLRLDRSRAFLQRHGLAAYGTRADLRERVSQALDEDRIDTDSMVLFLDEVEPWGKQHVLVYRASARRPRGWADPAEARRTLAAGVLGDLVDQPLPLVLPETLRVSSIRTHDRGFSVLAVESRAHTEHVEGLDHTERTTDGRTIEYRAYEQIITRGILLFRWDMLNESVTLHITQASSGYSYDEAEERFQQVVGDAVPFDRFDRRDLRRAIRSLYNQEVGGDGEARSHRYRYRTPGGRDIDISSPTADDSVLGEAPVDDAMRAVAPRTAGRSGNFYWLAGSGPTPDRNPIPSEQHITIIGEDGRVHFMTPSSEEVVIYVVNRIRALS